MKTISTNKLQNDLSRVVREIEGSGEIYQLHRYSKPVAYLVSQAEFERLIDRSDCRECVKDLRKLVKQAKKS